MRVVLERIPQRFGLDPVADVQVLTPMNRGGLGARSLNVALQERLNPDASPAHQALRLDLCPGGQGDPDP